MDALESSSSGGSSRPMVGRYVPQCSEDGSFQQVQCYGSTGYCWCVDRQGMALQATMTRGLPDCNRTDASGMSVYIEFITLIESGRILICCHWFSKEKSNGNDNGNGNNDGNDNDNGNGNDNDKVMIMITIMVMVVIMIIRVRLFMSSGNIANFSLR